MGRLQSPLGPWGGSLKAEGGGTYVNPILGALQSLLGTVGTLNIHQHNIGATSERARVPKKRPETTFVNSEPGPLQTLFGSWADLERPSIHGRDDFRAYLAQDGGVNVY